MGDAEKKLLTELLDLGHPSKDPAREAEIVRELKELHAAAKEAVKGQMQCEECDEICDEAEAVPIYECGQCGRKFSKEETGSNLCPDCHKAAGKLTDAGCPSCGEGELSPVEFVPEDEKEKRSSGEKAKSLQQQVENLKQTVKRLNDEIVAFGGGKETTIRADNGLRSHEGQPPLYIPDDWYVLFIGKGERRSDSGFEVKWSRDHPGMLEIHTSGFGRLAVIPNASNTVLIREER